MANTARSQLPFTAITINGVAVTTAKIYGSGVCTFEKTLTRQVTEGGIVRAIKAVVARGSFSMRGNLTATLETDDTNPDSTIGEQDLILIAGTVYVVGTVTVSYDDDQEVSSVSFQGTVPDYDLLGELGIVDETSAGDAWVAL